MHVISTSDLMPPDWNFLADLNHFSNLSFATCSGRKGTGLAALLRHPMAGRLQAAFGACRAARGRSDAVLCSHLPLMAAATNVARRLAAGSVPQIAFSFNFTTRPQGLRRRLLARAFRGIGEFVVFSNHERRLYAELFGIPMEKLVYLPWAMDRPEPGPENPLAGQGPYVCAIGGEARDYASFAQAMRGLPGLRAAIVARSYSLSGVALPPNVTAFTDLATPKTWALLAGSEAMVLPLRDAQTACGHITLVAAKLMGVPVIATESQGIADYVGEGRVAALVPPGNPGAIGEALSQVIGDSQSRQRALDRVEQARAEHDPEIWLRYFAAKASAQRP